MIPQNNGYNNMNNNFNNNNNNFNNNGNGNFVNGMNNMNYNNNINNMNMMPNMNGMNMMPNMNGMNMMPNMNGMNGLVQQFMKNVNNIKKMYNIMQMKKKNTSDRIYEIRQEIPVTNNMGNVVSKRIELKIPRDLNTDDIFKQFANKCKNERDTLWNEYSKNDDLKYELINKIIEKVNELAKECREAVDDGNVQGFKEVYQKYINYIIALYQFKVEDVSFSSLYNGWCGYEHPGYEKDKETGKWVKKSNGVFHATIQGYDFTVEDKELDSSLDVLEDVALENVGATCYMNATLQGFNAIQRFIQVIKKYAIKKGYLEEKIDKDGKTIYTKLMDDEYIAKALDNNKGQEKNNIQNRRTDNNKIALNNKDNKKIPYKNQFDVYVAMIVDMLVSTQKKSGNTYYSPVKFREKLAEFNNLFEGVEANDAKDFYNHFIMEMRERSKAGIPQEFNQQETNCKKTETMQFRENEILKHFISFSFFNEHMSFIAKLFHFQQKTTTTCSKCLIPKYNYSDAFFIQLPLHEIEKYCHETYGYLNNYSTLLECIQYNDKIETMSGENAMYCNICNQQIKSYYWTESKDSPEIIMFLLNRGKGIEHSNNHTMFPIFFRGTEGGYYMLSSVITHMGESGAGGHFINNRLKKNDLSVKTFNDGIIYGNPKFESVGNDYIYIYQRIEKSQFIDILNDQNKMNKLFYYKNANNNNKKSKLLIYQDLYQLRQQQIFPETFEVLKDAYKEVLKGKC